MNTSMTADNTVGKQSEYVTSGNARSSPTNSVNNSTLAKLGLGTSKVQEKESFSPSMKLTDYITAPSSISNHASGDSSLNDIFENFNKLYQEKMMWIDENIPGRDCPAHITAKKNVLEHWVQDVIEQNKVLVQTVDELEVEAEKKVQALRKKVFQAAEVAKEHMGMIKEYEQQIKQLLQEKCAVEKKEEFFRNKSIYLDKERKRALDHLQTLESDNTNLVSLISRVRDLGVWDISGLNFQPGTYDLIFGLYPSLPGSEVQTVFTWEKTRGIQKTDVAQIVAEVEELRSQKDTIDVLLLQKSRMTEELELSNQELLANIQQQKDEMQELKNNVKTLHEELSATASKNQSRPLESEMKESVTELRDLKSQIHVLSLERQQAIKESSALKMELRSRLSQMEELKWIAEEIQQEAACSKDWMQLPADQMCSLSEKFDVTQLGYQNANLFQEAKREIKLQNLADQLQEKVSTLDDWLRKQEIAHGDVNCDRDSGHLSDFSDYWTWNGNEEESSPEKCIQQNQVELPIPDMNTFESGDARQSDQVQQLLIENQRLRDEKNNLEQLRESTKHDKETCEATFKKQLELKDVEITMQKEHDAKNSELENLEEEIRNHCFNLQNKVTNVSGGLANLKTLTRSQLTTANSVEKDYLLRRSYSLLQQLEEERLELVGDCLANSCADEKKEDSPGNCEFLEDLRRVKANVCRLDIRLSDKIREIDQLRKDYQDFVKKVDKFVVESRESRATTMQDNVRMQGVIRDFETKQAQFDDTAVMENDLQHIHSALSNFDTGLLLTEKRLGLIQNSYDKLTKELVRRETLISQRDSKVVAIYNILQDVKLKMQCWKDPIHPYCARICNIKIAELESYIRRSEIHNSSIETNIGGLALAGGGEMSHHDVLVSKDEKLQKLIWLTTALQKKLKNKKEKEKQYKQEKETLLALASSLSSAWEKVRFGTGSDTMEKDSLKDKVSITTLSDSDNSSYPQSSTCMCSTSSAKIWDANCNPPFPYSPKFTSQSPSGFVQHNQHSEHTNVAGKITLFCPDVERNDPDISGARTRMVEPSYAGYVNGNQTPGPSPGNYSLHSDHSDNFAKCTENRHSFSSGPPDDGRMLELQKISLVVEECLTKIRSVLRNS